MLKQALASFRFAHFSLACAGLMWALPFLCPIHRIPLTTFYQEWGAAVLGLCAMPLLLSGRYWQQPEIPRIVLLPIGLMLLLLVQFVAGKLVYLSQTLLFALYLLWAALLVMLGRQLREEIGLPAVATVLAVFLLLGAELNTLVGILQHFRWHTFLDHMVLADLRGVFGNMGQPNHFADYISLGLASLGLLLVRWGLRIWQAALLAVPMLFVLALSGSRSSWLYLLCFAGMAFFWQRRDKSHRPLLYYSALLVAGLVVMQFAVRTPWLAGHGGETILDRMTDTMGGGWGWKHSVRLQIWYEAWLIFTKFPLLGAGFGQFGWQHFLLGPSQHNPLIFGLYNNAHNIVMQAAAEMGGAGLLVWLFTLAVWLRQMFRSPRTVYHWWGGGLLCVLAIHSLLEYPMWYAYFLGIAALTLGLLDSTTYRLELRKIGRISVASILLLGALSLAQAWHGYRLVEAISNARPDSVSRVELINRLLEGHKQIMLQPYMELAMVNLMGERFDHIDIVRDVNENVMHYAPVASVVYREVSLLALSGESEAARQQLERAIWAYPGIAERYIERLRILAQKEPARFSALVELANRTYQERKRASQTK